MKLNMGLNSFDLSLPIVMGIMNVTPDSFSDGGQLGNLEHAVRRAAEMVEEKVDIIDIGGESTRPGAKAVGEQQELDRVIPVIERIKSEFEIPVSIDTSKAIVMQEAVAAGASMINDVYALRRDGALIMASQLDVPVCIMHMHGEPRTMQSNPVYQDVVIEVNEFLMQRAKACMDAGITADKLIIDPGFGFGKTLKHNLILLNNLQTLTSSGYPVLAGISRKSMIGKILASDQDMPVTHRLYGSIAAAVIALMQGVKILRVHDVRATVEAVKVYAAVTQHDIQ